MVQDIKQDTYECSVGITTTETLVVRRTLRTLNRCFVKESSIRTHVLQRRLDSWKPNVMMVIVSVLLMLILCGVKEVSISKKYGIQTYVSPWQLASVNPNALVKTLLLLMNVRTMKHSARARRARTVQPFYSETMASSEKMPRKSAKKTTKGKRSTIFVSKPATSSGWETVLTKILMTTIRMTIILN